jgi:hypothetical protein
MIQSQVHTRIARLVALGSAALCIVMSVSAHAADKGETQEARVKAAGVVLLNDSSPVWGDHGPKC